MPKAHRARGDTPIRRWRMGAIACLVAVLVAAVGLVGPTPAAAAEPAPSVAELEDLVRSIENDGERKTLVTQLKALIEARRGTLPAEMRPSDLGVGLVSALADHVATVGARARALGNRLAEVPEFVRWLASQVSDPTLRRFWFGLLGELTLVLGIGVVVEVLVYRLLKGLRSNLESRRIDKGWQRIPLAFLRALLAIATAIAFAGAAYLGASLIQPHARVTLAAFAIVHIYLLACFALAAARFVLAPWTPSLHWLPIAAPTGQAIYDLTRRFAVVAIAGYAVAEVVLYFRLPSGREAVLAILGVVLAVMAIIAIVGHRAAVGRWIRGLSIGGAGGRVFRESVAATWHVIAIGYVVAVFVIAMLGLKDGFSVMVRGTVGTVVAVGIAGAVHSLLGRWSRGQPLGATPGIRAAGVATSLRKYVVPLRRLAQGLVWIVAFVVILEVWGASPVAWLTGPAARSWMDSGLAIAFILALAVVAWEAESAAIERYIRRATAEGRPIADSARARTLLPLLRKILFIVLVVLVVLIVLAELGINIAPLLAGAGVIGLAIGVGGQKLVQDVINGAFILFEDAIAVGDTVEVDGRVGAVEAISMRALRLRDGTGSTHMIPFSSIGTATNLSREFAYWNMDVGVAYREDVDEVMAVLKEIGGGLQADPQFGALMLDPIEVMGVDRFTDSAVIIKARIKTLPLQNWPVGREFNRRMKKTFDARGIQMPFPHATLYFGASKDGTAPLAPLADTVGAAQSVASASSASDSKASTDAASTTRRAKS